MNWLVDTNAKISIILLIALGAGLILRRRSAAVRHWVFAMAVACATATPLLGAVAPSWHVGLDVLDAETPVEQFQSGITTTTTLLPDGPVGSRLPAVDAPRAQVADRGWTTRTVVSSIWITGAGIALLVLLVGQIRLGSMASRARRIERGQWADLTAEISQELGVRRRIVLLEGMHPTLLGTWGLVRPKLVVPAAALGWTEDRARIVLRHELAHIRRADWAVMMTAACLRAIYWFNPLVWIAAERVRQEGEYACDDAVLNGGVDGSEYAGHLVELARTLNTRRSWLPAPAMARPSSLEGRISAMLNANTNRRPPTLSGRVATAIALLSVTISIAGFAAQTMFFTFSGSVLDSTNRFVPKVALTLSSVTRESKYEVKSDATGHFEFVGLPPGDYTLEARLPGFGTFADKITIIARNVDRDIQLNVGSLEETVTVQDDAAAQPIVTTEQVEQRQDQQKRFQEMRQAAVDKCLTAQSDVAGGKIIPPVRLTSVRPVYPQSLRGTNTTGTVRMEALIGVDGTIQEVRAIESPHPDLENAAIDAVRQWQFSQTLLNCVPIEVRMMVTARFVAKP